MFLDEIVIRPLLPSDESFLRKALYVALWDAPDEPRRPLTVLDDPRISALVADWGRPGDVGFLAEAQNDREQLGAVWIRSYATPPMGEEFLDSSIPHLGIAVLDSFQRMGIGTALMREALQAARQHYTAVALSVHPRNPARRLYEQFGFRLLGASRSDYCIMLVELKSLSGFCDNA